MTAIVETIEIARPPEDVFAYATDFARFPEWQTGVLAVRPHSAAPPALGAKAAVTRAAGPRKLERTEEITEFDPSRRWTVRGTGGPITAIARGEIEPSDDGQRSRVTITLDFEPHGIGNLLVPLLIRPQARRQLPANLEQLKRRVESAPEASNA